MTAPQPAEPAWLHAADGTRLHLARWAPPGGVSGAATTDLPTPAPPGADSPASITPAARLPAATVPAARATVVIAHGFGEHLGRYQHVAESLTAAGYAVVALDHRGHGRSDGPRGHVDRFADYLSDLHLAVMAAPAPRYLLGHSFGGLLALRYAARPHHQAELAGLILASPLLGITLPVPAYKRLTGRLLSRAWPTFTLSNGVDPATLSHDPAVAAALAGDDLAHDRASARFYTELQRAMRRARHEAAGIQLPTLVMQAGDDRVVSAAATHAAYAAMPSPDKQYRLYPGFYHEIFNEIDRARPLADLIGWLDDHQPADLQGRLKPQLSLPAR